MEFKPGDVVMLKSGGETMTVESMSDGDVDCVWFNGKKVERASFDPITLRVIKNTFEEF